MSQSPGRTTESPKKTNSAHQVEQAPASQQGQGPVQLEAPQVVYRRALVNPNGLRPADLLALQRTMGNHVVKRLVEQRIGSSASQQQNTFAVKMPVDTVQTKLMVGQAGEQHEQKTNRSTVQVMRMFESTTPIIATTHLIQSPTIQQLCPACNEELQQQVMAKEEGLPIVPQIQRLPENGSSTAVATPVLAKPTTEPSPQQTPTQELIVEDAAQTLQTGQMKKTEFLSELRASVCKTAEEILARTGQSTEGCPYLEHWFNYYQNQNSQHVERAVRRYAPETAGATSARDYIAPITTRVHQAVSRWAETGEISGVPDGVSLTGMGLIGGAGSLLPGMAGIVSRVATRAGRLLSGIGNLLFQSRPGGARATENPQAIQTQLGEGHPLDGTVKGRMESAFGVSFSHVRTHTDINAARLSNNFNARAFTLGGHIAFGSGEYQPGTLVGDALIAHELAHTLQQVGSDSSVAPLQMKDMGSGALEEDADSSAIGAMIALWSNGQTKLTEVSQETLPRLKSGLRLQACRTVKQCPPGRSWQVRGEPAGLGSLGCVCVWQCLPGGAMSRGNYSGPAITCDPPGSCPQPRIEIVDEDYQIRQEGTFQNPEESVTGWGAHMTPLGEQAACGCLPLDIEGNQQTGAPLLPVNFDITNLAGLRGRSRRTGIYQPGETEAPTSPAVPKGPPAVVARPTSPPAGGPIPLTGLRPTRPPTSNLTPTSPGATPVIPGTRLTTPLRSPVARHFLSRVRQTTVAKEQNTVIEPGVDVAGDVAAINAGNAVRIGNTYSVNGRTYGVHNGTLYPIEGPGFHQLNRGAFKALGVYQQFGDTPRATEILNNMGMGAAEREAARNVWRRGRGGE